MSSNKSIRSHSRPADHPSGNTRTERAAPKASLAMGTVYLGSTRQRSSSLVMMIVVIVMMMVMMTVMMEMMMMMMIE